ncbi:MAG TPA: phosphopentomutase [Gemmatimonadales bacterium]|nr:phosphopentomutase [Gemmatimonadales bacterium]
MKRFFLIVLDGVGCGAARDAAAYGDAGSDTIGNVARAVGGLRVPVLEGLGLGCIRPIAGVAAVSEPRAAYGSMRPASAGKDSTTGHWEICGLTVTRPFPTYPNGFPAEVVAEFSRRTGRGVLGNKAASGTAIIAELGERHLATGDWIVYTSADSVFQVAAHEEKIPLEELYRGCTEARAMLTGAHGVSRVIARPFVGKPGAFTRTAHRRDFSLDPVGPTLLDYLAEGGIPRTGIGKVDDLFAARNITATHTPTNADAYRLLRDAIAHVDCGLVFANVVEFDQSWGHRNDVAGFHRGLLELDRQLGSLLGLLREDDLFALTADHGNDPTTASTDHARENVPLLVCGPRVKPVSLGERATFADLGQTAAEYFGVGPLESGTSFLREMLT